ncbi:MAG TPA: iron-sulfur cluster assembly scaffold protein [Pyrinomonadaceae bacterium]|nr:iron-sulfur cluster assembly scaffold protein [Pyrinomonadaceae bacterium]
MATDYTDNYGSLSYSSTFKDHLSNPRNAGELPDANAIADEKNPVCGDRIRLSLIIADDRIQKAGYLAYGCPPTLVCGSMLTEMIVGKTISEAQQLTRADLLNAIGGLPSRKHHAAALAIETLNSALQDYRMKQDLHVNRENPVILCNRSPVRQDCKICRIDRMARALR